MNQFTRIFLLLITFSMITACSVNPGVQAKHDDGLDLSDFQTYNFNSQTEINNPDILIYVVADVATMFGDSSAHIAMVSP